MWSTGDIWGLLFVPDLHSDEGMPATLLCKGHGLDPQIPIPFPLHKGWGVMAGTWRTLWDME